MICRVLAFILALPPTTLPTLAAEGETVFNARCASCHAVAAGAPRGPGPNLSGLIGRLVGGDPDFAYSPVLEAARDSGQRWDEPMLRQFLKDPEEMFPGLWMGNNSLRGAADREAVVRFLAEGRQQAAGGRPGG